MTSTTKTSKHGHVFNSKFVLELIFLLFDIFQASNQSQPTEVTTESSEWKAVGPADRSTLPPNILTFCGSFRIYEIELEENPSDDAALSQDSGEKTYNIIIQRDVIP